MSDHSATAVVALCSLILGVGAPAGSLSARDCNSNSIEDSEDILSGSSRDENGNDLPDECESRAGDCNLNGLLDDIEIRRGSSEDCNSNGIPDECDTRPRFVFSATFGSPVGLRAPPACVSAADLDGDGDDDVAIALSADCCAEPGRSGSVTTLFNLGDSRLVPAGDYLIESDPVCLEPADMDGDGDLDLVLAERSMCCRGGPRLTILVNSGNGAFLRSTSIVLLADPRTSAVGDLDGDGHADVVVGSVDAPAKSIVLFLSDGSGGFTSRDVDLEGGASLVILSDLSGDNRLDMAAADGTGSSLHVLLNTGDATFAPKAAFTFPSTRIISMSPADMDGDGDMDVVTGASDPDFTSSEVKVFLNEGAGLLGEPGSSTWARNRLSSMMAADVDLDGFRDVLLLEPEDQYNHPTGSVQFIRGFGSGALEAYGNSYWLIDSPAPRGALSDMDGDGDVDLIVADGAHLDAAVWRNDGGGRFLTHAYYPVSTETLAMAAADLDRDGDVDLASLDGATEVVSLLINQGGSFQVTRAGVRTPTTPRAIVAGDLDGDGDADLAIAGAFEVSVLANRGAGSFQSSREFAVGSNPIALIAADLDGDQDLDLATANSLSAGPGDNVTILLGSGGDFSTERNYLVGTAPVGITALDVEGDGDADLLTANGGSQDATLLLNQGNGAFAPGRQIFSGSFYQVPRAGDIDGDGDIDLVGVDGEKLKLYRNPGDGAFLAEESFVAYYRSVPELADLDADGDLDLAIFFGYSNVGLLLSRNEGDGTFDAPGIFDAGRSYVPPAGEGGGRGGSGSDPAASALVPSDLDGDGDLDLALGFTARNVITIAWNQTVPGKADRNRNSIPDECEPVDGTSFRRADSNDDGRSDVSDAEVILEYLFLTRVAPGCEKSSDANDDAAVNLTDAVYILRFLFLGEASPPAPYPDCGPDPTPDALGCGRPGGCG